MWTVWFEMGWLVAFGAIWGVVLAGQNPSPTPQTPAPQTPVPGTAPGEPAPEKSPVAPGVPGQPPVPLPPGGSGQNPFFDTAPSRPPQVEKPKPVWPSLAQRLAKTRADYLGKTYLCQEAAYIGYYEVQGKPVAGFRVPERRQMVYLRVGDRFWNGTVKAIQPRGVEVEYREMPDGELKRVQMERKSYARGTVTAFAGGGAPPAGNVLPPAAPAPVAPEAGAMPEPAPASGASGNSPVGGSGLEGGTEVGTGVMPVPGMPVPGMRLEAASPGRDVGKGRGAGAGRGGERPAPAPLPPASKETEKRRT